MDYQKYFSAMSTKELLEANFYATGDNYLFNLSIALFDMFMHTYDKYNDALFYSAISELNGLDHVGYLTEEHFKILENKGIFCGRTIQNRLYVSAVISK
jgi:hypothetical protein